MKPAIDIVTKDKCTGCFGCYNSCPVNAIEMKLNDKGFLFPKINRNKCTNCGLCNLYCPIITNDSCKYKNPKVFASRSNDKKLLLNSSSGGIFGELAKFFLDNKGVVYGAGFDENLNLIHMKIDKISNLPKIQGSKYIQSEIGFSYKDIIKHLQKKKKVLFCGTPCQVASLNLFIKKLKPNFQENILTCDLVCHGVPSISIFKKYLEHLQEKYKSEIKDISFRSKKGGWRDFSMEINFKNKKRYQRSHRLDSFMQEFLSDRNLRQSCYNCKFSKIPRCGDITLGDLWGAKSGYYNPKGVSFVSINSEKGKQIINQLNEKKQIKLKKYSLTKAISNNPFINNKTPRKKGKRRKNSFKKNSRYILSKAKTLYQDTFYRRF